MSTNESHPGLGSGALRERIAKALWDAEIAESFRKKAFPERKVGDYAQWPADSLTQPYCQSTYRMADVVLAALSLSSPIEPPPTDRAKKIVDELVMVAQNIDNDTLSRNWQIWATNAIANELARPTPQASSEIREAHGIRLTAKGRELLEQIIEEERKENPEGVARIEAILAKS